MASLGMSNVRVPRPSFTYTNTLERWPPLAITFSAVLVPVQAGSWLMSMVTALGAAPSNLTTPTMVAAVAGSIGVAVGAAALGVAAGCSSVPSFLPHPARRTRPSIAAKPQTVIDVFVLIFRPLPLLKFEYANQIKDYFDTPPPQDFGPDDAPPDAALERPMAAPTRRCSSGVSWRM